MAEQKKRMGRPSNGATQILGISITPELKERIMARARTEHRSASSLACAILEAAFSDNAGGSQPAPEAEVKPRRPRTGGRVSEGATAMLTISLQPELKAAVQDVARNENRTTSNMACLMLRDWIMDYDFRRNTASNSDGAGEAQTQ